MFYKINESTLLRSFSVPVLLALSALAMANDPPANALIDIDYVHSDQAIDPASFNYPEVYEKPGYELSFSDEFDGPSLNPYKWNTQLRWDGDFNGERFEYRVINGEDQFYVNIFSDDLEHLNTVVPSYNPFEFDGSRLAIRAIRNPLKTSDGTKSYGPLRDIVSQQEFLSGAITTYDNFCLLYTSPSPRDGLLSRMPSSA